MLTRVITSFTYLGSVKNPYRYEAEVFPPESDLDARVYSKPFV